MRRIDSALHAANLLQTSDQDQHQIYRLHRLHRLKETLGYSIPPIAAFIREAALDSLCRWRNGTCNDAAESRDKDPEYSWPIEWWMGNMGKTAAN